jgi:hypothetical protein
MLTSCGIHAGSAGPALVAIEDAGRQGEQRDADAVDVVVIGAGQAGLATG